MCMNKSRDENNFFHDFLFEKKKRRKTAISRNFRRDNSATPSFLVNSTCVAKKLKFFFLLHPTSKL